MGMLANLAPEDATLGPDAGAWTATGASAAAEPQATAPGTLATDGYTYWYVGGTKAKADALQAWYDQFDASTLPYPYTGGCMSGCGPTAWAMLIAWGDRQAASGANSAWAGRWGLYREDGGYGADRMAPRWWDDVNEGEGVRHMIGEIRDAVDTFCPWGDSGATWPTDMWRVIDYLNGRSGMQVRTWSLPAGIGLTGYEEQDLETYARNVIKNEGDWARPTVIGTGFLSHYPLAYGYRSKSDQVCLFTTCDWQGCKATCMPVLRKGFYVNQGWGETSGEWVNSNLFFTGRLTPHQSYIDDVGLYRRATSWWLYDYGHDGHQDVMRGDYGSPGWPSTLRPTMADLDSDGVIDDLAAYVFEYWDASIRYDWRVDLDTDGTADGTLEKFSSHANGWPFALDWDRDGYVDDLAVFMPLWDASPPVRHQLAVRVNGNPVQTFFQDVVGFDDARIPVGGDFDRDGYHDDIAYFAPSTATWHYDLDHDYTFDGTSGPFGAAETLPISGDFDHDGYADDIGVYQPSTGEWLYDYDHNASGRYDAKRGPWGAPGDLPFAGNLDTR